MTTISTLTAVLNLDQSGFSSSVETAKDDLDGLQDRAQQTGERLTSAGKTMTAGVTAPLMAMGALSARSAANFDQAMQQSIAVMGDVDEAMRDDLEETAREVATATTISAEEAADAYYFLASAGLGAAQAMEAMPEVAAFAEAGQMDMAEATDVATNVMSAYGYEAEEMAEVTDRMTATVSNHNQTMEGMSSALSRVSPTAAGLGIELGELNAAIGALGDVGIQGERAGTALNTVISQMADETSPAVQQMEEMGVSVRDAEGEMLPLVEIIRQFEQAGADAGDMAQVFGTRGGPAMAALLEQGSDSLEDSTQNINEMEGATEEMAESQRETLNAELSVARSNVEDVGIAIGSQLLPMLSTLTGYVSGAAERFQGLSERQQQTIIVAGGLLAALGPVLMMAGLLAQSIVALSGAYATLAGVKASLAAVNMGVLVPSLLAVNVALGPITVPLWAIIAVIGVLIGAIGALAYAFYSNAFGIRDTVTDTFSTVKGWLDAAPDWLLAMIGPLGWLYKAWRENLFGVQSIVGQVFDWIGQKIDWLRDQISRIPGVGGDDGIDQDDIVDENINDAPNVDEAAYTDEFGGLGAASGQSFGESFADGVVDGLETDDAEEHLESELESAEERLSELRQGGLREEDVDEAASLEREIRDLEGQLGDVQEAEGIEDIDPDILADAAQAQIDAEEERQNTLASVADRIDGADVQEADHGEATPAMVADSLGGGPQEPGGGQQSADLTKEDLVSAFMEALEQWSEGRKFQMEQSINERRFRNILQDEIDAYLGS